MLDIPQFANILKRYAKLKELENAGVIIIDHNNTYIEDSVSVGNGTIVYPGTMLMGATIIGRNCVIGPNNYIADSRIADNCRIGTFCRITEGSIINPECEVEDNAQIKRSFLAMRVKAKHFCFIGDARIGAESNIGAGTVFCNYDGVRKNKTVLARAVFVGSGTMLIAPLHVGKYAYIAANSTITKDVPGATKETNNRGTLVIARGQQDRGLAQAMQLILTVMNRLAWIEFLREEERNLLMQVSKILEQSNEEQGQIHKIGYVRFDNQGWHIEKPKT